MDLEELVLSVAPVLSSTRRLDRMKHRLGFGLDRRIHRLGFGLDRCIHCLGLAPVLSSTRRNYLTNQTNSTTYLILTLLTLFIGLM